MRLVYFWVLCTLIATFAIVKTAPCQRNAYISVREKFPSNPLVFLNTEPRKITDGKCGLEWQKYGTCCDQYNMKSHIDMNEKVLLDVSTKFIAAFAKMDGFARNLSSIVKNLSLSDPTSTANDSPTIISEAQKFLNNPENLFALEVFATLGSKSEADLYKTEMTKCWTDMRTLRVSSLCSTCSGRSHVFFNAEKGLAEEKICRRAVENCLVSLKMSFKFIKLAKWGLDLFNTGALKRMAISHGIDGFFNAKNITNAYNNFIQNGLSNWILNVTNASTAPQDQIIPICKHFLNLAARPFILELQYAFSAKGPSSSCRINPLKQSRCRSRRSKMGFLPSKPSSQRAWPIGRRLILR